MFLVIANKPQQPAYLSALIPNDQVFDDDIDDEMSIARKKIEIKKKVQIKEEFDENEEEDEEVVNNIDESDVKQEEPIDNPFLRSVKYPVAP